MVSEQSNKVSNKKSDQVNSKQPIDKSHNINLYTQHIIIDIVAGVFMLVATTYGPISVPFIAITASLVILLILNSSLSLSWKAGLTSIILVIGTFSVVISQTKPFSQKIDFDKCLSKHNIELSKLIDGNLTEELVEKIVKLYKIKKSKQAILSCGQQTDTIVPQELRVNIQDQKKRALEKVTVIQRNSLFPGCQTNNKGYCHIIIYGQVHEGDIRIYKAHFRAIQRSPQIKLNQNIINLKMMTIPQTRFSVVKIDNLKRATREAFVTIYPKPKSRYKFYRCDCEERYYLGNERISSDCKRARSDLNGEVCFYFFDGPSQETPATIYDGELRVNAKKIYYKPHRYIEENDLRKSCRIRNSILDWTRCHICYMHKDQLGTFKWKKCADKKRSRYKLDDNKGANHYPDPKGKCNYVIFYDC